MLYAIVVNGLSNDPFNDVILHIFSVLEIVGVLPGARAGERTIESLYKCLDSMAFVNVIIKHDFKRYKSK